MTYTETLKAEEVIDLDAVVAALATQGVTAYVEQTGGGCATIYAGTPWDDPEGGYRYPAIAGPGWFDGPGFTLGKAHAADFYVGADDDGETDPVKVTAAVAAAGPAAIAALIAAQIARTPNVARVTTVPFGVCIGDAIGKCFADAHVAGCRYWKAVPR